MAAATIFVTASHLAPQRDRLVFPIKIAGRVVNLLYVDNGSQPLAETAFAALGVLCQQVAAAYERLIVARKRRHC